MNPRPFSLVLPGTDVGGYTVERPLGAGGFGAVYLARRGLRLYALKLIPLWGLGPWAEREVAILLRLKHPHLVRIRGHGQTPDEAPHSFFIAMDYVEGRRLDTWAQAENPTAHDVVLKMLGVARGLAAAHEAKVIHRDLKEANILVRDSDGEAVIVDFGAGGYESAPHITGGVLPPGTPAYRAPEAWRFQQEHGDEPGPSYQPGPSDDLYAAGVILYWLLTGRHPFSPDEASDVEAVIHRPAQPPQLLNPRVPPFLGGLCLRLLAKSPEDRFPDAQSLCAALEALLPLEGAFRNVKLCDAYGPDTATTLAEGPWPEEQELVQWAKRAQVRPRRGPHPPAAAPLREPRLRAPMPDAEPPVPRDAHLPPPSALAVPPVRFKAVTPLRAAAALCLLVFLSVGMLGLVFHGRPGAVPLLSPKYRSPEVAAPTPPVSFLVPFPAWSDLEQEVAPPRKPLEAHSAAAPLPAASIPAAVAVSATLSQDTASVKMKKNVGAPPSRPKPQQRGLPSRGQTLGLCMASALGLACPGPQVRPTPPPENCPPGAVEAMDKLGIEVGNVQTGVTWAIPGKGAGRSTVKEGRTSIRIFDGPPGLRPDTILSGKLIFGDRVYGRFTEARLPEGGGTVRVCMELVGFESKRGLAREPGSTEDNVKVWNTGYARAVDRFE